MKTTKTKPALFPLIILTTLAIALSACAGGKRTTTKSSGITPEQLLGQSDVWVIASLGQPTFKRHDGGAKIWQYKNTACVLSIFIYENLSDKTTNKVLHFDARDLEGNTANREECLKSL